jgi:hypothetical protein
MSCRRAYIHEADLPQHSSDVSIDIAQQDVVGTLTRWTIDPSGETNAAARIHIPKRLRPQVNRWWVPSAAPPD